MATTKAADKPAPAAGSAKRVRVRFKSTADLREAFVKDISRGGMFLRVPPDWPLRARLVVVLELPDKSLLELTAEVVHRVTQDQARAEKVGVGVSFLDFDSNKRARIEKFLTDAIEGRSVRGDAAEWEERPTREVSLQEIARRVQARLERIEDVSALPELHGGVVPSGIDDGLAENAPSALDLDLAVDFDPSAGTATPPANAIDADLLRNLTDELSMIERGRAGGSPYDVLGVKPDASLDTLAGIFRGRMAALSDDRLAAVSPELERRIATARRDLEAAHATVSDAKRRAALDVSLRILRPHGRNRDEMEAHRHELARRRGESPDHERAEWPRADPLMHEARNALGSYDARAARRAVRQALLFDPYNTLIHDLLDQIEQILGSDENE